MTIVAAVGIKELPAPFLFGRVGVGNQRRLGVPDQRRHEDDHRHDGEEDEDRAKDDRREGHFHGSDPRPHGYGLRHRWTPHRFAADHGGEDVPGEDQHAQNDHRATDGPERHVGSQAG